MDQDRVIGAGDLFAGAPKRAVGDARLRGDGNVAPMLVGWL